MTAQLQKYNILLIGDTCWDDYVFVESTRKNPENDSPLLTQINSLRYSGMVHNVHRCLVNLMLNVTTVFPLDSQMSVKTRYIDIDSGEHICRVDKDIITTPINNISEFSFNQYDCIVISDYNKGYITTDTIKDIRKRFDGSIFLDTKKTNLTDFRGCFIKINSAEAKVADSLPAGTVVTQGNLGATLMDHMYNDTWPALDVECLDVCGAGDAFLAGYVYGWLETKDIVKAIRYGIVNSGISVTKSGTYAPLLEDFERGLEQYAKQYGES